jgi:hypothetical protein
MATDAYTKVADVIVPSLFRDYVIERTAELSAVVQSGIVAPIPSLNVVGEGGTILALPFWQDLSGESEIISEAAPLAVNKIQAAVDKAIIHHRGKAWGATDLSGALAGDDPMAAIGTLVAAFWARDLQAMLFASLKGVFASTAMAANAVLDISGKSDEAAVISGEAFLDAAQLLGDSKEKLTAIAMHSAVETALLKQDLLDVIPDALGGTAIKTFLGKRVIVDDSCPRTADGVYTTYIFGEGAFGYGEGTCPVPVETTRNALASQDVLINRRSFILHPRGVAWTGSFYNGAGGSLTTASPTNTNLETGGNWTAVYEQKNIRMVKLVHRIDEVAGS